MRFDSKKICIFATMLIGGSNGFTIGYAIDESFMLLALLLVSTACMCYTVYKIILSRKDDDYQVLLGAVAVFTGFMWMMFCGFVC